MKTINARLLMLLMFANLLVSNPAYATRESASPINPNKCELYLLGRGTPKAPKKLEIPRAAVDLNQIERWMGLQKIEDSDQVYLTVQIENSDWIRPAQVQPFVKSSYDLIERNFPDVRINAHVVWQIVGLWHDAYIRGDMRIHCRANEAARIAAMLAPLEFGVSKIYLNIGFPELRPRENQLQLDPGEFPSVSAM